MEHTATLTLEGTVDVGEGGNTITNITTAATGDQVDPSTVGDDLDESVVVNDAADLVTVKTFSPVATVRLKKATRLSSKLRSPTTVPLKRPTFR